MTFKTPSRFGPWRRVCFFLCAAVVLLFIVRSSASPDQADGQESFHEPSFERPETMTADLDTSDPPQTQMSVDPVNFDPVDSDPQMTDTVEGAVVTEAGVGESSLVSSNQSSGPSMTFEGHPLRKMRDMIMLVTAYSPDDRSCGIWARFGVTASGKTIKTNNGKLVAADTNVLPFGSIVSVPGYHASAPVPVLDRGSKVKGNHIDLLFPTHAQAVKWGVKRLRITVWELADQNND